MSAHRWPMRTLSPAEAGSAAVAAACARMGVAVSAQPLPARGSMLRFDVVSARGELQLAVAADDWCPAMLPDLADLAWSELVDRDALACWLPARDLLDIAAPDLQDAHSTLRDVVPVGVLGGQGASQPCLHTAQGPAWILQARAVAGSAQCARQLDMTVPVDLGVARFELPLQRLRTLAPGAVLLLDQLVPVARSGRRRLYSFDFTLETITVNTTFDFLDDDGDAGFAASQPAPDPTPTPAPASGLDLSRLPVTVDVVLCQLQQHVAALAVLQPGTVVDLPPDAWTQLQLRVNGQLIARGELVQVGDQLGVQLHQVPVLP